MQVSVKDYNIVQWPQNHRPSSQHSLNSYSSFSSYIQQQ